MVSAHELGRQYGLAFVEAGLRMIASGSQEPLAEVGRRFDSEVPLAEKAAVLGAVARTNGELLARLCVELANAAGVDPAEVWSRVRLGFEVDGVFGEASS